MKWYLAALLIFQLLIPSGSFCQERDDDYYLDYELDKNL